MQNLIGHEWGPASEAPPRQVVILCHWLGGNGTQFLAFAPRFAVALPDAVFAAPDAPDLCDMGKPGPEAAHQWFTLQNRRAPALNAGARRAAAALDGFIDMTLAKHGLPPDAYALVGFSQGAMIALFCGLRRAVPPRAIMSYCGALIDTPSLDAEMKNRAPVLLVHGEVDATVPPYASRLAEEALAEAGVPVERHVIAQLGHGINEAGVALGVDFLRKAFAVDVAAP